MGKQKIEYSLTLVAIGNQIRQARKKAGLSQEKLAEIAELHTTTISEIECGKSNLTISSLEKIANSLQVPASSLMPDMPETKDKEMTEIIFRILCNNDKLGKTGKRRHLQLLRTISSIFKN